MTVARKLQNASALNAEEQQRMRAAIRHLHARVGDWMLVAKSAVRAQHDDGHGVRAYADQRELLRRRRAKGRKRISITIAKK